jgi:hypothetical protein
MRLHAVVLFLLCVSAPTPVSADALAPTRPRGATPSPADNDPPRRTGRVPARIAVAPPAAAPAPNHVVITIPRDVLRQVMEAPRAGAVVVPGGEYDEPTVPADRFRHLAAAGLLALAVLSLPLVVGLKRRGRAAALVVVAALAGAALVRADIAAPRPRPATPAPAPTQPGGAQTVEVIIVAGKGPVQVQLMHLPRP